MKIESAPISKVLENLKAGAWQVPKFQREFVWSEGQVISLVESIFAGRPIGMITLWEQPDEKQLPLEPVSIPDWINEDNQTGPRYYAPLDRQASRYFAVLDGVNVARL